MQIRLPHPKPGYNQHDEAENRRTIELALNQIPNASSGLDRRRDVVYTTGSLAPLAEETGTIAMGAFTQELLILVTTRAGRLRLYANAAARSQDAGRSFTTEAKAGIGVLADFKWDTAHTKYVSPEILLYNADGPVTDVIYYSWQNLSGSTGTAQLTFTVLTIEAGGSLSAAASASTTPKATSTVSGTVKTDADSGDPVVYLKGSVDTLLSGKSDTSHTHTNLPTNDQKDALAGTNGTPSSTNKYVTNSDPRLSATTALTQIGEVVTASSQATISFSSIPNTYRSLLLVIHGRGTASATDVQVLLQFNSDTGSNYDYQRWNSGGTASANAATSGQVGSLVAATTAASYASVIEAIIGDYKGTTFYKTVRGSSTLKFSTSVVSENSAVFWKSTSAISSITISLSSGNFVDGSVATLYGVS